MHVPHRVHHSQVAVQGNGQGGYGPTNQDTTDAYRDDLRGRLEMTLRLLRGESNREKQEIKVNSMMLKSKMFEEEEEELEDIPWPRRPEHQCLPANLITMATQAVNVSIKATRTVADQIIVYLCWSGVQKESEVLDGVVDPLSGEKNVLHTNISIFTQLGAVAAGDLVKGCSQKDLC